MKIDLHVHTRKCKQGDASTREISASKFAKIILSTEVRIIAITNHNIFDIEQYTAMCSEIGNEVQIWPGIELDIVEDDKRGHLLVVVSPNKTSQFSEIVESVTKKSTPDSFTMSIEQAIKHFDSLGPLYITHYQQKMPDISQSGLIKLVKTTANPRRVLKEVTNSISAGIYISHGHASIYGSDVHNWDQYEIVARDLPDLRLPVESFEHFCLLLEKDPTTINTLLDRKKSETLTLRPFDDNSEVTLSIYNDINVFFGSKGTGKSCLLKAIAKYFSENGVSANVFESGNEKLEEQYDLKGKNFTINLEPFGINYCTDQIIAIKGAAEVNITSLHNYINYYKAEHGNRNAKKICLKDIDPQEESGPKRKFEDYNSSASTVQEFLTFLSKNVASKEVMPPATLNKLIVDISGLLKNLQSGKWNKFLEWKTTRFLNNAIKIFKSEVTKKTGTPAKPPTTGFRAYALNRIKIEANTTEVLNNIRKSIDEQISYVGNLGADKGELECRTKVIIQDGSVTDSSLLPVNGVRKTPQKDFVKKIEKIVSRIYTIELFETISELNNVDGIEEIRTINELLLFKKYFFANNNEYHPSSGESSMIMLQNELGKEKDIYILDEPEKSLGNDYINDVIVPLIKDKARAGKKIFISTHDANIAVRTLPYCSIYRCHGVNGYETYIGNPFSNYLVNIHNSDAKLDWKIISMKTLEGGVEAFGERGKIYGNT